jgi:hypothetical protein
MFEPSSRYDRVATAQITDADGRLVTYKRRRRLPDPAGMRILAEVKVADGDRLDLIAARTLGNPEMFWLIADASNAMDPFELTDEPGRVVRVPIPEP